jgi:hypothetical protein
MSACAPNGLSDLVGSLDSRDIGVEIGQTHELINHAMVRAQINDSFSSEA